MGLRPACSRIIYDYTYTHIDLHLVGGNVMSYTAGNWLLSFLTERPAGRSKRGPPIGGQAGELGVGWTEHVHTLTSCSIIEVLWLHVLLPPLFGTLFYITICICS